MAIEIYEGELTGSEVDALLSTVSSSNLSATHKITRSATIVIAASDSSEKSKAQADYVCDGVADDIEIQAAIDALPSLGGIITFLEGNYTVTARIVIKDKTTLILQNAKLSLANATNDDMFSTTHGRATSGLLLAERAVEDTDITIVGVGISTLNGNKANQTARSSLISVTGATNVVIDNLTLTDAYTNGIEFVPVQNGRISNIRASDIACNTIICEAGDAAASDIIIKNIYCDSGQTSGYGASIWLSGVKNVVVDNIHAINPKNTGINIKTLDAGVGAASPSGVDLVNVSNLFVENSVGGSNAISISSDNDTASVKNVDIQNIKVVSSTGSYGLYINAANDVDFQSITLRGNINFQTTGNCIFIDGNYSNRVNSLNILGGKYTTGGAQYAMRFTGTTGVAGVGSATIRDIEIYNTDVGIWVNNCAGPLIIENPYIHGGSSFCIALADCTGVHIVNPMLSNTSDRVIGLRNITNGTNGCIIYGGKLSVANTNVIEIQENCSDNTFVIPGVTRATFADSGARNTLNGVGLNAGVPSSEGVWNGNGYEGVKIVNTSAGTVYEYVNGTLTQIG